MCSLLREDGHARQFAATDALPFVQGPKGEKPIELKDLDIRVVVSGLIAETTQTMRFFNPNLRDMEGNLTFPLPDGAAVCHYALDVRGGMVEGVVVPKQEARRILEAEERKGIDPGLIEKVQGNLYRTRIYPLPAGGSRTVKITYVSGLTVSGNDAAYHLPLKHAETVDKVTLRVEVAQAPVTPELSGGIGNMQLTQWENRWVAEATLGKGTPAEDLQVRLPRLPDHFTLTEKTSEGEVFFCLSSRIPEDEGKAEAWIPQRLAVAWDASGSRRDSSRDTEFLEELIMAAPGLVVDLLVFRDCPELPVKTFHTGKGETGALLAYLRGMPCDGGTNLAALDFSSAPHEAGEAWLLFSDGLGTLSQELPKSGGKAVIAVTGQAENNSSYLRYLAESTGGLHINLLRTPPAKACTDMLALKREALEIDKSEGCNDLHRTIEGSRFTLIGRLSGESGSITLKGKGAPAGAMALSTAGAPEGRILARAWAGMEADKVSLTDPQNRERLLSLGRTYGLVTPGTSLLVLESIEQYIEYDIEPPLSLPEMVAVFRRRREQAFQTKDAQKESQIERIYSLWEQRIVWWERDFEGEYAMKKKAIAEERASRPPEPRLRREAGSAAYLGAAPELSPIEGLAFDMASMESPEPEMDLLRECSEPMPELCASLAPPPPSPAAMPSLRQAPADAGKSDVQSARQASITIKPWAPDTPYLTAMRNAPADQQYSLYMEQRAYYGESPAFFFDCGDFFLSQGTRAPGLRILSNLVELGIDDAAMIRMYAWRLQQAEDLDLAIELLEKVLADRGDEPQSYRDLGLALGLRWERGRRAADLTRAMELLWEVVLRPWDRFPEIELIALMELNRLIHLAKKEGIPVPSGIDSRFIRHLDLDIRISMSWDADLTDVDLHVFEPGGDHAYYGHNLTDSGGLVSRDFREGYGPEEYVLKAAQPGAYTIKAHYYGSRQQSLLGPCTVITTVFTDFGRENEKKQVLMLRLDKPSSEAVVGEITIEGKRKASPQAQEMKEWQKAFRALRKGMTVNEIVAAVGQPLEIKGDDEMMLVYKPQEGVVVHVLAAPRLTAVKQIMEGAELDLL
ncbi:MAG: VIT domain-containing protein [Candidatus Eremiobacteraeota bacterium]|nr:VIT domain-containing protein [Candidatus Eremiobacteraeota bacterium]